MIMRRLKNNVFFIQITTFALLQDRIVFLLVVQTYFNYSSFILYLNYFHFSFLNLPLNSTNLLDTFPFSMNFILFH
jgi:hypothetical protein